MARAIAALVRHGAYCQPPDTPSAHLPHPLTDEGRAQARACARTLLRHAESLGVALHERIDVSSLLRAFETGAVVAGELRRMTGRTFELDQHEELAERSVGAAANLTLAEIAAVMEADPRCEPPPEGWKSDGAFRLPFIGAESLLDAGRRVAGHLERLLAPPARGEGGVLRIVVGHGGSLRHAAVHLGLLTRGEAPGLSMHHCRPVLVERLADGIWKHVAGEWKVRGGTAAAGQEPREPR